MQNFKTGFFGGVYNVKRLEPGLVKPVQTINSYSQSVHALVHDATTLGGNSGSPVLDVNTGEIVALHFAGRYLQANFAVPMYELARDQIVVDAGVNFIGSAVDSNMCLAQPLGSSRPRDDTTIFRHPAPNINQKRQP